MIKNKSLLIFSVVNMKKHSLYETNNNFLSKISHSDGTWTNFGKVFALDSILHIFLLFSFLMLFFALIILPSTAKAFEKTISESIFEQFSGLKDTLDNQLSPENSAIFYGFLGLNGDSVFNYLKNYFGSEDTNFATNNYFIWIIIVIVIVFLFIITALLMSPYFEKNRGGKLLHILILNLFILSLVGLFEGLFFVFVIRSENHVSNEYIQNYIINSFQEKFNTLLDNPSFSFNERPPLNTAIIVLICVLVGIIFLVPIFWFYVLPKMIRLST